MCHCVDAHKSMYHLRTAFTFGVILSATAQRFEDSSLLDSILDEVFVPCVTNSSNFTTATQQPSVVDLQDLNGSTGGNESSTVIVTTEDVGVGAAYINQLE